MPIVTHVKSARKENPVAKRGESYYWWKTRTTVGKSFVGTKHYSKAYPKRSQLTQSDFFSQMYDIEDDVIAGFSGTVKAGSSPGQTIEDLQSEVNDAIEQIRALGDEQIDKLDNMPEGLQEGPTGELLQGRYDECEVMASELEGIDLDDYDEDSDDSFETWLEGKIDELQAVSYNGE